MGCEVDIVPLDFAPMDEAAKRRSERRRLDRAQTEHCLPERVEISTTLDLHNLISLESSHRVSNRVSKILD